jgi:hypothetical protein
MMVDDEESTVEETCAQIQRRGYRVQALACSPSRDILSAGDLLPLCGTRPAAQLELSLRQYHVFARGPDGEGCAIGESWRYIAPIHRRRDAIAVSVGLVESGLAVEAEVCVIAQSPGPLAGRLLLVHREASGPCRGA